MQRDQRMVYGLAASHALSHTLWGLPARSEAGVQLRHDRSQVGLFDTQARAVTATTRGTFTTASSADVFAVANAVPSRYENTASWISNKATYNRIRQMSSAGYVSLFWGNMTNGGMPFSIIARPIACAMPAPRPKPMRPAVKACTNNMRAMTPMPAPIALMAAKYFRFSSTNE